jgi:aminoglycoside phosphotransferase (APT) family kinase protein
MAPMAAMEAGPVPVEDPVAVGGALAAWLAHRFGGHVHVAGTPVRIGEGMDTTLHRARFAGAGLPAEWRAPLVIRIQPTADRAGLARHEAAVQTWCRDHEFPVPRVLAVLDPGEVLALPVQVMQRVPGTTALAALLARPWTAPALLGRLAGLQAALHALPVDGWPEPDAGASLGARRIRRVPDWAEALHDRELADALTAVEQVLPALATATPSACHGDFHPLNVMVDGPGTCVLDWTDAALGDRHGDVSRTALLFRVAAVTTSSRPAGRALRAAAPMLVRTYLRAYRRHAPLDPVRVARWETVHLLHGWGQVAALHAGLIGDHAARRRLSPALGPWLRARLARRLAELG